MNARSDTPQKVFYSPVTGDIAHSCKTGSTELIHLSPLKPFDNL